MTEHTITIDKVRAGTVFISTACDRPVYNSIVYGRNWLPVGAAELPSSQVRAMAAMAGETIGTSGVLFRNESSRWVAFYAKRADGSIDFYTIAPDGRESYYTATISPDGVKAVSGSATLVIGS